MKERMLKYNHFQKNNNNTIDKDKSEFIEL